MQFAGQRTDMDLNSVGEPVNILVKLNEDALPSPQAILVTGITPQKTLEEGYTEAEFAHILINEVFTPETITVGYNNIRFDDEFIRHLLWRNFHDPYEWCWKDGCSRWDVLDIVRMTRALRPGGIKWPTDSSGKPVNKLELLAAINGISHVKAHDALSDVEALIALTRLIKTKQPQLFEYLLKMRDKNEVKKLVNLDEKQPFVYSSGRYDNEHNKTTVAFPLTSGSNGNVVVYDLRYDPTPFIGMSLTNIKNKLYASWEERSQDDFIKLPVKELQYNKAPAVAPLGVLGQANGWKAINLNTDTINSHKNILLKKPDFAEKIRTAFEERPEFQKSPDAEAQLYDGFVPRQDKIRIEAVRNADARELADFNPEFIDERLGPLLLRYKARNYPNSLSESEATQWELWRSERIAKRLPKFMKDLQVASASGNASNERQFILEELKLWAENIMPTSVDE